MDNKKKIGIILSVVLIILTIIFIVINTNKQKTLIDEPIVDTTITVSNDNTEEKNTVETKTETETETGGIIEEVELDTLKDSENKKIEEVEVVMPNDVTAIELNELLGEDKELLKIIDSLSK